MAYHHLIGSPNQVTLRADRSSRSLTTVARSSEDKQHSQSSPDTQVTHEYGIDGFRTVIWNNVLYPICRLLLTAEKTNILSA
ncbi:hypothetical protein LAZ67_4002407 [Cordylochernes scorpioides]|uniref:Uncharacterized protein n=1 Tax=Cordylochernes scorpioides TaxID=51811 RepID=A0ABY6KCY6_9ARAC|nr:hypothetical protein LAZ67_4002407 [Cordylochernes scorpioides]